MIRYLYWSLIALLWGLTMRPGKRYTDSLRWDVMRSLIRKRDGYKCRECKRESEWGVIQLHCHHKRMVKDGGGYFPWNLTTLCGECHSTKHEWMQ